MHWFREINTGYNGGEDNSNWPSAKGDHKRLIQVNAYWKQKLPHTTGGTSIETLTADRLKHG